MAGSYREVAQEADTVASALAENLVAPAPVPVDSPADPEVAESLAAFASVEVADPEAAADP